MTEVTSCKSKEKDPKLHEVTVQLLSNIFLSYLDYTGTLFVRKYFEKKIKKTISDSSNSLNKNGKRLLEIKGEPKNEVFVHQNSIDIIAKHFKTLKRCEALLSENETKCAHFHQSALTELHLRKK